MKTHHDNLTARTRRTRLTRRSPKSRGAVMVLALVIFGGWQIAVMVDFFQRIFERIPTLFM